MGNSFNKIYYDPFKQKIHLWETIDGKRYSDVIDVVHEYYIEDETGESPITDPWGRTVIKKQCKSKKQIDTIKESGIMCFESDISQDIKFLHKRYEGRDLRPDIKDFNICSIDIEIESDESEFPHAHLAKFPINLITIKLSKTNQTYTFALGRPYTGEKKINYKHFEKEVDMIESFICFFLKAKVDIITGWNSSGLNSFDIPYIINRSTRLGVQGCLSPVGKYWQNQNSGEWSIPGIALLDYMRFYLDMKFVQKKFEQNSLDYICKAELGHGKLHYDGSIHKFYKNDWNKFVEYNISDVELVDELDQKKQFIKLAIDIAHNSLIPIDKVFTAVAVIEGQILKELHANNMVMNDRKEGVVREELPGAWVESRIGYYEDVISYDVESEYPNMMLHYNISPECLVINPENTEGLISTPLSKEYGIYYKKELGFLTKIVKKNFEERKEYKTLKKKYGKEGNKELESYYDSQQGIRKVFLNCFHQDTDIMTERGIKKLKDVKIGEMVYSINPETEKLELKKVVSVFENDYDGYMYFFNTRSIDIGVTPEHKMLMRNKHNKCEFIYAKDFYKLNESIIPLHKKIDQKIEQFLYLSDFVDLNNYNFYLKYFESDLRYTKKKLEHISLEQSSSSLTKLKIATVNTRLTKDDIKLLYEMGYLVYLRDKRSYKTRMQQVKVNVNDFSKFVGYYLSEGSAYVNTPKNFGNNVRGVSKKIVISQYEKVNKNIYEDIRKMMLDLFDGDTINIKTFDKGIYICSDLLYEIIEKHFGTKYEKKIYGEMFEYLNKEKILEGLYAGDGTKGRLQFTISIKYEQYFQDFLKLILELGFMPRYRIEERNGNKVYRICWNKTNFWLKECNKKIEHYAGKIYCLTVEDNHTVCVGTNGKFIWTGQSIYGVLASEWFHYFNINMAKTVTLSGQHMIKHLRDKTNEYFNDHFYRNSKFFSVIDEKNKTKINRVINLDTDSIFFDFGNIKKTVAPNEPLLTWANNIDNVLMKPLFKQILDKYFKQFGVTNEINFKIEKICSQMIMFGDGGKIYAMKMISDEGKIYNPPELKISGFASQRSSTPSFCRDQIQKIMNNFFEKQEKEHIISLIKQVYEQFKEMQIEDISSNRKINDYNKYAPYDAEYYVKNGLQIMSRTPQHNRAAMVYNVAIEKYKLPLEPITGGTKIKFIYVTANNEFRQDVIGYVGKMPEELKQKFTIDYKRQFEVTFLNPMQSIFDVMGWGTIDIETENINNFFVF